MRRVFVFDSVSVSANRIGQIHTSVDHPDDSQGLMYFTEEAYREGDYQRILQDGEPKEVYADSRQRSFNTSRPLQANVAEDGRLHLRFYSPRELRKVLVKARIPSAENEFFNLAYFESLPAFADFYQEMPLLLREGVYQTESGRYITLSRFEKEELRNMELKIPLFSFCIDGVHHEDLALILDKMGIAVRSGQMCAEPLMDRFGVSGMLRVSLAPYNTMEEAVYFMESLKKAVNMLR